MFSVSLGEYEIRCQVEGTPDLLPQYLEHAQLAEQIDMTGRGGGTCYLAVAHRSDTWPFLVITQRYEPAGFGFYPGVLVVPETRRLFLGAGKRLLAYDLSGPTRLWEDAADCGFWFWSRWGDVVLMGAELELAAWDLEGHKLWSRFADPPWEYRVEGDTVVVKDCRAHERISLLTGELTG